MAEDEIIGTRADWLADKALRGLIASVMALPYRSRVPMMGSALRHAIGPLAGYRRRAEENLALVYPDMGVLDRRRIAGMVCDNFGRTLIENYSHKDFAAHLTETPAKGEGLDAIAENKGRPVIFVTGHYGNHEAPRQVLTRLGYVIGGLYRKMANPYFNAHYAPTMTSWGGPVFEQGGAGTIGFARHIKGGGMGTLLFDVHQDKGTPLDFLGLPARTALSAAEIALKFDALLIPYFGIRHPDGVGFDVIVESPIPHSSATMMMQQATDRLADRISEDPAQWFWVHRRWKTRKREVINAAAPPPE
ncbi:KDO2-lipid IV(A) lauroyltransferase [Cognatiyoonia koreensis]|uniref:KDO2-lipid IV(A) lauroyltransferase n=1 Tax=Cognatiyoonia koreensis TaxID=364200 RepID=A0A1I0NPR5_9RHOB|nr:lauroyl acyltransferase [Cognatiyoonia koreensis]SEW03363.1 KDO2-lipid IV(A) lauroyltransferase [Cognatiyoonia koreensis]